MKTSNFGLYATLVIVFVTIGLAILHEWVVTHTQIFPDTYFKVPYLVAYLFLLPLSLLGVWFVYWRYKKDHTAAGRAFFIVVFVKIFASAIFLFPGVVARERFAREMVFQFMPAFFILLFVETYLLVKLLNQPLSERKEKD